jgi:hypothetical protein
LPLVLATVAVAASGAADEWPGFRGPNGDGTVAALPANWSAPKLVWKQPVAGECHAGMAVADGVLVTPDHDEGNDFYRCLDARTGAERWVRKFPNGREMQYGAGPRANPLVHDGKVVVLSAFGELYCLDLKTGRTLWQKDFSKDFGTRAVPTWGFCGSPVVAAGKLIVQAKNVMALDPGTGKVLWQGDAAGVNYSTPVVGTFGGVEQVITFDAVSLGGWQLADGKRLWKLPVPHQRGYIVPSPVKVGARILITVEDEGGQLFGFDAQGRIGPEPVASNESLLSEVPTATLAADLLLAAAPGLVLLDAKKDLQQLWKSGKERALRGDLHIIAAKDRALTFNPKGHLSLLAVRLNGLELLGQEKLCEATLMHPSLAGGCIYVRDSEKAYCYDLRK